MKNITITEASIVDKEQLAKTFQHFKDNTMMNNRAECYLSHNYTFIAKDGNKIIGKMLWLIKGDPNFGVAEFEELYVFENYRRKGIGSELVRSSIKAIRKHFENLGIKPRCIYLFTNENNQSARKLYEKFGFKYIANLGHLFSENEHELFYILDMAKFK
ncbi:MAG: GNAT family N-acetyltransferase [Candidatus Thorarchaeota archaeon]